MRRSVSRRVGSGVALAALALMGAGGLATPVAAQAGLSITTPFPAVSVQPGQSISFDLTVSADEPSRVDLSLDGVPKGWDGSMSGGGNEVQGVFVDAGAPATVTLNLILPDDAAPGAVPVTVIGRSGTTAARLQLDLTVAEAGGGAVTLESDFPSLRGPVDTDFAFNLTLSNDTPGELTFALQANGPDRVGRHDPAHRADDCGERDGARAWHPAARRQGEPERAGAGGSPTRSTSPSPPGSSRQPRSSASRSRAPVEMQLTTPDELLTRPRMPERRTTSRSSS